MQSPCDAEIGQAANSLVSASISELSPISSTPSKHHQSTNETTAGDSQAAHAAHSVADVAHQGSVPATTPSVQPAAVSIASAAVPAVNTVAPAVPSSPAVPAVARLISHKRASTGICEVVLAQVLEGSCGVIWAMAFSRDGSFLATAGQDGVLRIWQLTSSR